jgi:PII-like signaling protein
VSTPWLELRAHLGERDRSPGGFAADQVLRVFADCGVAASALMRGVEGYGTKHLLRSDRLLSLSEDPPLLAIAADERARIEAAAQHLRELPFTGPVTLRPVLAAADADANGDVVRLQAYLPRGLRANGRPAYERAVEVLHSAGALTATALLGVDGTARGERRRARFFAGNAEVPAVVIGIGAAAALADAVPALAALPGAAVLTVAPVRVVDGAELRVEGPAELALYAGEQDHHHGRSAHVAAVTELRRDGAPGATALRGTWGYRPGQRPQGDRFASVRRRVPTVTLTLTDGDGAPRALAALERVAEGRGLIVAEPVTALVGNGERLPS